MKNETKAALQGILMGSAFVVGTLFGRCFDINKIPNGIDVCPSETQSRYVPASEISVKVQKGYAPTERYKFGVLGTETIVEVEGKPYGLMYNKDRKPTLVPYEQIPQGKAMDESGIGDLF